MSRYPQSARHRDVGDGTARPRVRVNPPVAAARAPLAVIAGLLGLILGIVLALMYAWSIAGSALLGALAGAVVSVAIAVAVQRRR